jgi:hypothetical protein
MRGFHVRIPQRAVGKFDNAIAEAQRADTVNNSDVGF